jgi:hypothetical protein
MMRALIALTVVIAAVFRFAPPVSAQVGFDRRGSDYTSFPVRSGDPAACAARCDREASMGVSLVSSPGDGSQATNTYVS